jgi:hypothetical protein
MAAVIGALRAELSMGVAQFEGDAGKAAAVVEKMAARMQKSGERIAKVGQRLTLAVTAPLVLFAKTAYDASKESAQALGQVESALKSMGNQSGKTAQQLQASAKGLQNSSLYDDDEILRKITANLLTFGNVQGKVFDDAQQNILDMSARLGEDLQSSAIRVGKALNDPINGLTALRRVGVQFTDQQKEQIKGWIATGQGAKAQAAINAELAREFGGAAKAMRDATPGAKTVQSWRDFQETVGKIITEVLPPLTDFLNRVLDGFQALSPEMQKGVVIFAAMAAVVGPILVVFGNLISLIGGIARAAPLAVTAVSALAKALIFLVTDPLLLGLALAAAAIGFLAYQMLKAATPTKAVTKATDDLTSATDAYDKAARAVIGTSGEARVSALKEAAAKRELAIQARAAAVAQLQQARATLALVNAEAQRQMQHAGNPTLTDPEATAGVYSALGARQKQATANAAASLKAIEAADARIKDADAALNAKPVSAPPLGRQTFSEGGDGAKGANKIKAATDKYREALRDMNDAVSHGLDERALPKATASAEELRRKIADITQDAKQSGVAIGAFAGEIAMLQARIKDLETKGLADEAAKFGREVAKDQRAVNTFASGGLDPLNESLQSVDDAYDALREKIEDEIKANEVLAETNDAAAKSMAALQGQLAALDLAHVQATAAAKAQYAAEQQLADLQTKAENLQTATQIRDLQQAAGQGGPMTARAEKLQALEDDLAKTRLDAAYKLKELETSLAAAKAKGDLDEAARLQSQIDLQSKFYDLVSQTTAAQIDGANRVRDAFQSFESGVSDGFMELSRGGKGALATLKGAFDKLADDLFIKPGADMLAEKVSGVMKSLLGLNGSGHKPTGDASDPLFVTSVGGLGGGGGDSGILGAVKKMFGGGGGAGGDGGLSAFLDAGGTGETAASLSDFAGLYADGGRLKMGQFGIVGEQGPELFAPSKSGYVIPHEASFGGGTDAQPVIQNFNIRTSDAESFGRSQRQLAQRANRGLAVTR